MNAALHPENVTAVLAQFVAESRWDDIPQWVRKEAKRSILNVIGCSLGGCRTEVVERALSIVDAFSGPRETTVIGRQERVDLFGAAYVNAMSADVLVFDDTHVPTVIHPSCTVAPPLLAWSEHSRINGQEFLHAFILGVEACCRIGNAISPWHYSHGFHITSTCGVFGSAAAIGKVLGLSAKRMAWAFGNAAVQSCGIVECLADMAKNLGVGNAARNGIVAALLAQRDFTGGERAIEGAFGLARVMGNEADLSKITAGLGESWELGSNHYKPYPTGVVLHPVIDACLELRRKHALRADDITQVAVRGNPLLRERADRPAPRNGLEASLSLQHCCAVAFIYGAAGLAQFSDEVAVQPAVLALRVKVGMTENPSVGVGEAQVTVHTASGASYTHDMPRVRGAARRVMTDEELEAKFLDQAAVGAPGCDARSVIDAIKVIDACDDVAALARMLVPTRV